MKNRGAAIIFMLYAGIALFLGGGCSQKKPSFAPQDAEEFFNECAGDVHNNLLTELNNQFELFLYDNGFYVTPEEKLSGYKAYLQFLLDRKELDTSWVFRNDELEELLIRIEEAHLAEAIFDKVITYCVLDIPYPNDYLMSRYHEIMPQHTVSPEKFASEFILNVDEEQFRDPVVRKMVSLEYFLGPLLYLLRPDELYYTESRVES